MPGRAIKLPDPSDCSSMRELRESIDALDRHVVEFLALRSQYIDRAVELKRVEKLPARD